MKMETDDGDVRRDGTDEKLHESSARDVSLLQCSNQCHQLIELEVQEIDNQIERDDRWLKF
jgi:hypothetical protein